MTRGELPPNPDGTERYDTADSPTLDGLGDIQRAQVVQALNVALLVDIVREIGGEIVLPPGYQDRLDIKQTVETKFLDDGSYRVRLAPLPEVLERLGEGRRFVRVEDPRNDAPREIYEIVQAAVHGEEYAGLIRVEPTRGKMLVHVKADYLRRRVGWRPWYPGPNDIESVSGKPS